ncbi:MAG: hypothetical protein JSW71_12365 [Gemmatimonadota bacterium]|nr:MAG: hypothetical protein JSW71_12365 [Gemmatimonadota bacterium]
MKQRPLLLSVVLFVVTFPCEAQGVGVQETQQRDSLTVLQQQVRELEQQLEQLTDLVVRLESRLLMQEQKTRAGMQSSNHSHRPIEISNLDNEVVRIVRARCSLSQSGGAITLSCR